MQIPTQIEGEMEKTELHSAQLVDVEVFIYPFFLNIETEISRGNHAKIEITTTQHTTRLSPLSFFPVSLRQETISAHTPIMMLTMSTSPGREKSPVSIAFRRDCVNCIQSRCPAPLRRVTMNSVIEKRSSMPVEAVSCRQRVSNLTSKVGYCSSPRMYPLPRYSL